jgi:predicted Rossmann-fold nucleotide-binding protein
MTEKLRINSSDIPEQFRLFKERVGFTKAIGIIGGSGDGKLESYKEILTEAFEQIKLQFGKFAIVSGGTGGGVPELALDTARKVGLPTIGSYPLEKEKFAVLEKIDFAIPVPPQQLSTITWGVETPTLVSIPDVFILIGGEWGTLAEVSMIMKRNRSQYKNNSRLIPIVSMLESGLLADNLKDLIQIIPTPPGIYLEANNTTELVEQITNTFNNF